MEVDPTTPTRHAMGEPDPFRLQYRYKIKLTVGEIVRRRLNKPEAKNAIREQVVDYIPEIDQPRFIEIIEKELVNLHEGNIARFQLRLKEYEDWKKTWL